MIAPLLKDALEPVAQRHRRLRLLDRLSAWWAVLALVGGILFLVGQANAFTYALFLTAVFAGALIIRSRSRAWEPDYSQVARKIEQRHPELHALLATAVEQTAGTSANELNYLQQRTIAEAIRASRKQNWLDAIPVARWARSIALQVVALGALLVAWRALDLPRAETFPGSASVAPPSVEVSPGDATIERGSGLVVLAKFQGEVPGEATLVLQPMNEPPQRIPLVRNLSDPVFGGGVPEVQNDLTYHIAYNGTATRDFAIRTFEHPRLERADAALRFPEFTGLAEKKLPDVRRVSAVVGSRLNVSFHLNKPVKSASLLAKDGASVPLTIAAEKPLAELRDFPVSSSAKYELVLADEDGRASKVPAQFAVEALPNRRPELKFTAPKGDQRVSPIQELAFRAEAWDDFGLARYGLAINVAGRGEEEIELGTAAPADERRMLTHLLKLEELGVKPDELVSWFLWAEDAGADGQPRRTVSDIFFAEVRPFEEIYRAGDGDEGGQQGGGGGGDEAVQLAEMQKQILTATWNLKRSEDAAEKSPTEKYAKDQPVVRDSQAEALEKVGALAAKVEDPKSLALVENVKREMGQALDALKAAEQAPASLPPAIAAEQGAYNALLKLAAHEFRVVKNQQGGGGGGGGGNQQQLDQLELKDEKQRYETKREAEPAANEQQREQLAVLNRLKELAQRQGDINERLKELQNALEEAKTEREKEEIKRQLRRLREEEQQLLADVDEARQKMEQSPQQAQFADERRQLDETRDEAQKAAESLEKNAASQALASGTRAARQLEQMRDDLRKKASGQFTEAMRQMRTEARELAENQAALAEQLRAEAEKPARPTLDGEGEREKVTEQLEKQQGALASVTEEMKRVSEQAEAGEPLLAKELYETLRKSSQAGTDETLRRTQLLAERGYQTQARKFEEKARREIEELKSGVERAAESVLGDEAEALRQARAEVDTLTAQLDREIAAAAPEAAAATAGGGERERTSGKEDAGPTGQKAGESTPGEQAGSPTGQAGSGSAPGAEPSPSTAAGGAEKGAGQSKGREGGAQAGARSGNQPGQRGSASGRELGGGGIERQEAGPLTGEQFAEWSDRLRNVEEMVDDPELRTEAARVREVAKGVRAEFKRHSVQPNWDIVNTKIRAPLAELRNRLTEELARRESKENLVPIDRDPVPTKYAERVRRYYEEIGRSR